MTQPAPTPSSRMRAVWRRASPVLFVAYVAISAAWLGAAVWSALHTPTVPPGAPASLNGFRTLLSHIAGFAISGINFGIGLFFALRKSFRRDATARFLALGMIGTAAAFNADAPRFMTPTSFSLGGALSLGQEAFLMVAAGAYVLGLSNLVLSEDGSELSVTGPSGRWLGWLLALAMAALAAASTLANAPGQVISLLGSGLLASGLLLQGFHARPGAQQCERESARIFLGVLFVAGFFSAVSALALMWLSGANLGFGQLLDTHVALVVLPAMLTGLPVALLFGIVRHPKELLKALEYAVLSTAITVGYVAVHVVMALLIEGKTEQALEVAPILSAALVTLGVVLTFDWMKEWLTDWARLWVLGEKAEPEAASLVELSRKLAVAKDRRALLDLIAEHTANTTEAIAAQASLSVDGTWLCRWAPYESEDPLVDWEDVKFGGVIVGRLGVTGRYGRRFDPRRRDRRRHLSYRQRKDLMNFAAIAALAMETHIEREASVNHADACRPPRPGRRPAAGQSRTLGPVVGADALVS